MPHVGTPCYRSGKKIWPIPVSTNFNRVTNHITVCSTPVELLNTQSNCTQNTINVSDVFYIKSLISSL